MDRRASTQVADEQILPARTAPWQPLGDGQLFELGGVTVKVAALPGHTSCNQPDCPFRAFFMLASSSF